MTDRVPAPELPVGLAPLDRPGVPRLGGGLRGHVVAVLVWRLGCVHSRHALADLAALQQEFLGRAFAVIAVHAPMAQGEADDDRVRAALLPLSAPVTVLLDRERAALQHFGGAGYPTLLLIDPAGRLCYRGRGEPNLLRLRDAVAHLLDEAARAGQAPAPAHVPLPAPGPASAGLHRPGGLCGRGDELWLADTGHHRLLCCELATGQVRRVVGSGRAGSDDGPAPHAQFRAPAGIASLGDRLLVADTGNHALRAVDPTTGAVTTVCGTGRRVTDRHGGGFGAQQGLCSPVSVLAHGGAVYVAQAGAHQLWQFDPDTQAASAWLGTGALLLRDGGEAAAFHQPWALAADDGTLWVADAGNGALRAVELAHSFVRTIDGSLQRPVGVAVAGGRVLVADAWAGDVRCYDGGQPPGRVVADRAHGLREPAALAVVGGRLLVADAGAGAVFELDLQDAARPLRLFALRAVPDAARAPDDPRLPRLLQQVALPAHTDVTIRWPVPLPADERLDALQPIRVHVGNDAGQALVVDRVVPGDVVPGDDGDRIAVANLPVGGEGAGVLRAELHVTVRTGAQAAPAARTLRLLLPVAVTAAGAAEVAAELV